MSISKDNSHSWSEFSWLEQVGHEFEQQGARNLRSAFRRLCVEIECGVLLQADQRPKQNHKDEILPAHRRKRYLLGERIWTDVEPGEYPISDYDVSKKLIQLLRHGSLPREDGGAIDFWRIRDNLQKHFLCCHHWSDESQK